MNAPHNPADDAAGPGSRNAVASFFIARPVFALVLAIATVLAGVVAINNLSISQYPEVAPPTVRISASYPGATAEAVENSVTTKIEGAMTGLEGLIYMTSSSTTGSARITLTFSSGVDPAFAQVEVQNKLAQVESNLPDAVRSEGVTVSRSTSTILMVANLVSPDGRYTSSELSNMIAQRIEERIQRVDGVGEASAFGSGYAMRIWLDPNKLAAYSLVPADVVSAVSEQNVQVSAGSIGATPTVRGQQLTAKIVGETKLTTVDQFERIILKSAADGAVVRLTDVARVELGMETYGRRSTYNGRPAAGFRVELASGANAVTTAAAVKAELERLSGALPAGVELAYSYETTPFVEQSIEKVISTLVEAIILVFVILLIFLQSFRATLIPMVAVPVVVMGSFAVLAAAGYSINMLTMFAMVLAIGLLVDDAIVVVENVSRIMQDEDVSAREATERSMGEITGALVGVAVSLAAVFAPMAFFSGSVGVIYRQFSITVATAMLLSAVVAIVLTPALCAAYLRPTRTPTWFAWFNEGLQRLTGGAVSIARVTIARPLRTILLYVMLIGAGAYLFERLPTSFLPAEDQGVLMTQIKLPNGANAARTQAVINLVEDYYLNAEKDAVESVFMTLGFNFSGSGENVAMGFIRLKDFDERADAEQTVQAVAARASAHFAKIRDAEVFVLAPPAIRGLGQSAGFTMYLEDSGGEGRDALITASNALVDAAVADGRVVGLRGNERALDSQLKVAIDQEKAGALGVDITAANALLSTAFAGSYVNDFIYQNDLRPVWVQADAEYRMQPSDLMRWRVRNQNGEMVPLSAIAATSWTEGPPSLERWNGVPAIQIQGAGAAGVSSGDAMSAMEQLVASLNGGYTAAWSGLSYQERLAGAQAAILYAASVLVVFLCLAALYESWSVPLAVIFAVPTGVLGALVAANLFGQDNDIYFKVGLLTTIGLAAKNAILIVEFARERLERGGTASEAAIEAVRLRLRPILMTSLAFILGVTPLALASGAGAAAQNAIGLGVLGGMVSATVLGVIVTPLLFVIASRGRRTEPDLAKAELRTS